MADRVEVLFPFGTSDPDQIPLIVGETIQVVARNPSGWWIGKDPRGLVGAFPVSYTKEVRQQPKFQMTMEQKSALLTTQQQQQTAACSSPSSSSLQQGQQQAQPSKYANVGFFDGGVTNHSRATNTTSTAVPSLLSSGGGARNSVSFLSTPSSAASSTNVSPQKQRGLVPPTTTSKTEQRWRDDQEMKALLGLDDDDDVDEGEQIDHHHAMHDGESSGDPLFHGGSTKMHHQQRGSTVSHLSGGFISETYFDGPQQPRGSISAASSSRKGSTAHSSSSLDISKMIDTIVQLRKDLRRQNKDTSLLRDRLAAVASTSGGAGGGTVASSLSVLGGNHSQSNTTAGSAGGGGQSSSAVVTLQHLREQVAEMKYQIALERRTSEVLQQKLAIAKCLVEGTTPPEFQVPEPVVMAAPMSLENSVRVSGSGSNNDNNNNNTAAQSANAPAQETASPPSAAVDDDEPPEAPQPIELDEEPVAAKIIHKLNKRIRANEETLESYQRQEAKLNKRISKLKAASVELHDEIEAFARVKAAASRGTGGGDGGVRRHRSEADDDVTTGDDEAPSADDSGMDDGDVTDEALLALRKRRRPMLQLQRRIFDSLSPEEQADLQKYQLVDVRLREKMAKLKERTAGENQEATELRGKIEKLKKRLSKGDEAMEQLCAQCKVVQDEIASLQSGSRSIQQRYDAATAAVATASRKEQEAQALLRANEAKAASQRKDLLERIEKEKQRNAAFEAELAALLAKQQDAAG